MIFAVSLSHSQRNKQRTTATRKGAVIWTYRPTLLTNPKF